MTWKRLASGGALLGAALMLAPTVLVTADESRGRPRRFAAVLRGFSEVPSISTNGLGTFSAALSRDGTSLHYKLRYSGLTAPVTQAHIHFGERHTNGGIMVWLCSGPSLQDPTGLAPACVDEGSVEGTITEANIVQPGAQPPSLGQGIAAGEFDEFLRALRAGAGYVNVHTTAFPPGEIRGQVR